MQQKLVRDNIPKIITDSGRECVVEELDMQGFAKALSQKLQEEVDEFLLAFDSEDDENAVIELADVIEVAYAILDLIGVTEENFDKIRQNKANKNGTFSKRLLLKEII